MTISRRQTLVGGGFILLAATSTAWGQCIDTLAGTGATSVLDASGQGNFSCADMSPGPDGGLVMADITAMLNLPVQTAVTQIDITVPEALLPDYEIDAVYIRANGNGARCLYTFSDYSPTAVGLQTGGADFDSADVIVCGDLIGKAPAVEPEVVLPVSTVDNACTGQVLLNGDSLLPNLAVVTAVSLDGQTLAVCNGDALAGTAQAQCVNVCKNFTPRAEDPECALASAGLTDGQLDLEACRPCDLTDLSAPPAVDPNGDPVFYCWEYTNSVVRDPPLAPAAYPTPGTEFVPGTDVPRTVGTLLPHKEAWSTSDETKVFNGCYTKTTYLNGYPYTYTTCK